MKFLVSSLIVFSFITLFLVQCKSGDSNKKSGEELAKLYCASCHLYTEPTLLDKKTWQENVMKNMGWRLGIRKNNEDPYADMSPEEATIVRGLNIYPEKPLLSISEWEKIEKFYFDNAPDSVSSSIVNKNVHELSQFTLNAIKVGKADIPQITLLKYDTISSLLYAGSSLGNVYALQQNFQLRANWNVGSPPVDIDFEKINNPDVLCIGSVSPSDTRQGSFAVMQNDYTTKTIIDSLARPVQVVKADLDGNNVNDLLICEFGNYVGGLSWYPDGDPSKKTMIRTQPGAIRIHVTDMNQDGLQDIIALFAQAKEEIILFTNKGKGVFDTRELIQFPPVYGSNYFDMADFNKDGHMDILYTAGDNWDLSPIRKNYHGVRIFMNDGKNNFKEEKFIDLYGASKAIPFDFDNDGDLDIAAIAFYNDFEHPEQSFMFFENQGDHNYKRFTALPAESGKWITMEKADLDKDGDMDLVLGSYFHNVSEYTKLMSKGVDAFPHLLVLSNKIK